MAFVSKRDERERVSKEQPLLEYEAPNTFSENFTLSLGKTIDQNLSISSQLNKQEWGRRNEIIKELEAEKGLDINNYSTTYGRSKNRIIDYDKLNKDFPEVKTDSQLKEERAEAVRRRGEFADEQLAKPGSVAGTLAGEITGYVLDPLNVLTMGVGASVTTARTLAAVGQAALKTGAISAATESAIQPLVYNYKEEVGIEYTAEEALQNISMAAAGGALLGGAGQGISELIKGLSKNTKGLIPPELSDETDRIARLLDNNPLRTEGVDPIQADLAALKKLDEAATARPIIPEIDIDEPKIEGVATIRNIVEQTDIDGVPPKIAGNVTALQKSILEEAGEYEAYEQAILKYEQIKNDLSDDMLDSILDENGKTIRQQMDESLEELDGLESINKCLLS